MTPKEWVEQMKPYPCYTPCPPFYDVCNNMDRPNIKRLDCDECVAKNKLKDYIE